MRQAFQTDLDKVLALAHEFLAREAALGRSVPPPGESDPIRDAEARYAAKRDRRKEWRREHRAEGYGSGGLPDLDLWERGRLAEWAAAGRLSDDGRLRVPGDPPPPWTTERIRAAMPHLTDFKDQLAVLIFLDGVFMNDDEKEKAADLLMELIETAVGNGMVTVFGHALATAKRPLVANASPAMRAGKAKAPRLCSKCKEEGHRAPSCPKDKKAE